MKRKVLVLVLSSLSIISRANELVYINKENPINSIAVKEALVLLMSQGLIIKDTGSGKYILESTNANILQTPNNVRTIDLDALESQMKSAHNTDF